MNIVDFPHCCTAHIMVDFGESYTAEGGAHSIKSSEIIKKLKFFCGMYNYHALFVATTNNQQKTANKTLLKLGFSHSRWLSKKQHPNTKVRLWYISINKLNKKLKEIGA